MSMKLTKLILVFIFLATSISFSQETEPIDALVTDRPDQTESSSTMQKGFLQIETGVGYESYEENNIEFSSSTLNTTLMRFGLLDNLELRLGWDFVEGSTKISGDKLSDVSSGFSPLLIGVKIGIAEEKNGLPEIALLLHTSHPFFAGNDFKTQSTGTDFRFSLSHTLSEKSSLAYNLGMVWDGDITSASYIYTLVYGYSLTHKLGCYAELYGDIPEGNKANHLWNAGFTYLVSNNFQLDILGGTSITKGQDLGLGFGASFRIPSKK